MSDTTTKSWAKRIHEAEKRGGFTEQDIKDAWFWGACAIGEYPDEVKASLTEYFEANDYGDGRGAFYEPSQMTLIEHGCNFGYLCVNTMARFIYYIQRGWESHRSVFVYSVARVLLSNMGFVG